MSIYQLTHIDYHPAGSELALHWCLALGHDEAGDAFIFGYEDGLVPIGASSSLSYMSVMAELITPLVVNSNCGVVAGGLAYCTWLSVLSTEHSSLIEAGIGELLSSPIGPYGVRLHLSSLADFRQQQDRLAKALLRVFDDEISCQNPKLTLLEGAWELLRRNPRISPIRRVARAVRLFEMKGDIAQLGRLLHEYHTLDRLPYAEMRGAAFEYEAQTALRSSTSLLRVPAVQTTGGAANIHRLSDSRVVAPTADIGALISMPSVNPPRRPRILSLQPAVLYDSELLALRGRASRSDLGYF